MPGSWRSNPPQSYPTPNAQRKCEQLNSAENCIMQCSALFSANRCFSALLGTFSRRLKALESAGKR
eukprot:15367383-Alexandrium_andersonii.AAC.1